MGVNTTIDDSTQQHEHLFNDHPKRPVNLSYAGDNEQKRIETLSHNSIFKRPPSNGEGIAFTRKDKFYTQSLTHSEISNICCDDLISEFGDDGVVWIKNTDTLYLWRDESKEWVIATDRLVVDIGNRYISLNCKKSCDYTAIASLVKSHFHKDDDYFIAPSHNDISFKAGFASRNYWHGYNAETMQLTREPLAATHRQLHKLYIEPDKFGSCEPWLSFLHETFRTPSDDKDSVSRDELEQIRLLQQIMGVIMYRLAPALQQSFLFLGDSPQNSGANGKSTMLEVLKQLVPIAHRCASPPDKWKADKNFVESLRGKLLNIVGELSGQDIIPAREFKGIIAGDEFESRAQYKDNSLATSTAAHVFCSNVLPPTLDTTASFYRRICVLIFANMKPKAERESNLAKVITTENMPYILWYAQQGLLDVLRSSRKLNEGLTKKNTGRLCLFETRIGELAKDNWVDEQNLAIPFFTDPLEVTLKAGARKETVNDCLKRFNEYLLENWGYRKQVNRKEFISMVNNIPIEVAEISIQKGNRTNKGLAVVGVQALLNPASDSHIASVINDCDDKRLFDIDRRIEIASDTIQSLKNQIPLNHDVDRLVAIQQGIINTARNEKSVLLSDKRDAIELAGAKVESLINEEKTH